MTPENAITDWIKKVQTPQKELKGQRICPFANNKNIILMLDIFSIENIIPNKNLTIYVETSKTSSYNKLEKLCRDLADVYQEYVFLPDHPQHKTTINNIQTNNNYYPCIIVQTKEELHNAREILKKTDYYSYWDQEYLKEIKSFG